MTDSNVFFRWVYRLLALMALVGGALLAFVLIQSWWSSSHWRQRQAVEVTVKGKAGKPVTRQLRFYGLESLKGTDTSLLRVADLGAKSGRVMSSSYLSNKSDRNLVFLQGDRKATWLFPRNDQTIREVFELCLCEPEEKARVLALYLEVVTADSNGDGETDEDDLAMPALVRADGTGYTPLLDSPVRLLGRELSDDGAALGVLYESKGQLIHRQYTMEDFSLRAEQVITSLEGR